jgi:hypothetical protein
MDGIINPRYGATFPYTGSSENIIDFEDGLPHKMSWVICLKCLKRWLAVRPQKTKLVDLECSNCGPGYVIETGEEMDD